jgi:transcriptional antiterminator NusG
MESCATVDSTPQQEADCCPGESFPCYALQVLSNCEAKVKKSLTNRAKSSVVNKWIGRILFPVEILCEVRNGKKVTKQKKLYPGYLFVEMDLYDENDDMRQQLWRFIMETDGVSGFVGSGKKPMPLKRDDAAAILLQAEAKQSKTVTRPAYDVGAPVKITDGPFSGSGGDVESLDEEAGTLRVSVNLFGRKTPVDLEFWQVTREEV